MQNSRLVETAIFLLLALLTIPARIPALGFSLWLDEAWVANSVLSPTLEGTLNYANWVQSSPPLYLALERLAASIGGPGELSLRFPSLAASLAALMVIAVVLRRSLGFVPAVIATAMLAANYTQLKYGQQVKQYATDMLVAAVLAWLMALALEGEDRWRWRLVAVAAAAPFLSFPSVFFLPPIIVVAAIQSGPTNRRRQLISLLRAAAAPAILLAINYYAFIRPNRTPALLRNWRSMFIDVSSPVQAAVAVVRTIGDLLVPEALPGGGMVGVLVVLIVVAGAALALHDISRGKPVARLVVAAGVAPLVVGLGAACAGLYPMLWNTRMLIWALPSCGLIVAFTLHRVMTPLAEARWLAPASVAAAVAVVIASQYILLRNPRPGERNREAVTALRQGMRAGDCLYLQGGLSEQFAYYSRRLDWSPPCLYLGNTGWPCCGRNIGGRVGDPEAHDITVELQRAAELARGNRLWLLLPAGTQGHWSMMIQNVLRQVPTGLDRAHCVEAAEMPFGQTKVITCRPAVR